LKGLGRVNEGRVKPESGKANAWEEGKKGKRTYKRRGNGSSIKVRGQHSQQPQGGGQRVRLGGLFSGKKGGKRGGGKVNQRVCASRECRRYAQKKGRPGSAKVRQKKDDMVEQKAPENQKAILHESAGG